MAVDSFLKLGTLKGESIVKGQVAEIQVDSWQWGMSQSGTTHTGTGGGAGKVNVQDIGFSKRMDSSSPNLILAVCKGKHYETATLTCRKAGDDPLIYLIIEMTDLIITSYQTGGASGMDQVDDSFTVNFAAFTVKYQPQDNKGGKKGGTIDAIYNIAEND
jgi:type VI secretion system secreted protein Hcp